MVNLDEIRNYRFAAEQWKTLRQLRFRRSLVIVGIIFGAGVLADVLQSAAHPSPAAHAGVSQYLVTSWSVLGAVYLLLAWRQSGTATDRLISYQLTMGPNVLRTAMLGMLPTEVLRSAVRKIEEDRTGLKITYDGGIIVVPSGLPDYAEVRTRLSGWATIQKRTQSLIAIVLAFGSVAWFASFGDRLPLAALLPIHVVLLVGLGIGIYHFRRTRLDAKQMSRLLGIFGICGIWLVVRVVMEVSQWLRMK